jgi:hypothetical protein
VTGISADDDFNRRHAYADLKPNGLFPFVDMKTGCLTEHGLQLLSQITISSSG